MKVALQFVLLLCLISCRAHNSINYSVLDRHVSDKDIEQDMNLITETNLIPAKYMTKFKEYIQGQKSGLYKDHIINFYRAQLYKTSMSFEENLRESQSSILPGAQLQEAETLLKKRFNSEFHYVMNGFFWLESKSPRGTFYKLFIQPGKPDYASPTQEDGKVFSDSNIEVISYIRVSECRNSELADVNNGESDNCLNLSQDSSTVNLISDVFSPDIGEDFEKAKLVHTSNDFVEGYFEGFPIFLNDSEDDVARTYYSPPTYKVSDKLTYYEGDRFGYEVSANNRSVTLFDKEQFYQQLNRAYWNQRFVDKVNLNKPLNSSTSNS